VSDEPYEPCDDDDEQVQTHPRVTTSAPVNQVDLKTLLVLLLCTAFLPTVVVCLIPSILIVVLVHCILSQYYLYVLCVHIKPVHTGRAGLKK